MSAFLIYILKVALLTAAFVILYHLLFRRDTFFGTARTVLVSSLVMAYILPFCVITIHKPVMAADSSVELSEQFPEVLATIPYSNQEQPVVLQTQNQLQAQQPAVLPETKHRHIDWTLIAIAIYAAGVLSLITIRLMSVRKVTGIIRRGRVVMEKDGCKVIVSKDNIRPFSWMRYIVLPESLANLSWTSPVIRHEYSHISHHHSAELIATDILSAFQWFNPAVWLLRHDLCCVQEFQADASVLESGLDKTEYSQSLLNLASEGVSVPFVNGLSESNLRARIRMMNRKISRKANLLKLIYFPVVILVSLSLMANTVYDKETMTSVEEIKPGTQISGTVLYVQDMTPLNFARVFETDDADSIYTTAFTDENGHFSFPLSGTGHILKVTYTGCKQVRLSLDKSYYQIMMHDDTIHNDEILYPALNYIRNNALVTPFVDNSSSQNNVVTKDEYQKLLSRSYLLTPDTLRTREQLSIQLKLGDFMNTYVTVSDNHQHLSASRSELESQGIPSFYYDILQYQLSENNTFIDNMFEDGAFTRDNFDAGKLFQDAKDRYWNEERPQLVSRLEQSDGSERQKSIDYIQNNRQISSPGETPQQTDAAKDSADLQARLNETLEFVNKLSQMSSEQLDSLRRKNMENMEKPIASAPKAGGRINGHVLDIDGNPIKHDVKICERDIVDRAVTIVKAEFKGGFFNLFDVKNPDNYLTFEAEGYETQRFPIDRGTYEVRLKPLSDNNK